MSNVHSETPRRIVEPDGHVHTGCYLLPFEEQNLASAPFQHPLAGLRDGPFGWLDSGVRRLRLKRWHYTSVVHPRFLFACAVVHVGYVGNAFAYVYDRERERCHAYSTLAPLGRGIVIADDSRRGTTSIRQKGFGSIELTNEVPGKRGIRVALAGRLGRNPTPPLKVELELADQGSSPDPIYVVEESEPSCWLFTHKVYGLDTRGTLRCGALDLDVEGALAGLDYNVGYRPRETCWNWAAAAGHSVAGDKVGFNLTAHRRWDAPFDGTPDAGDCALWLGDRCYPLAWVAFDYDHEDILAPWHIRDGDGLVDLHFEPAGERREDIDFGVVVSRFHQPYGRFSGTLRSPGGERYELGDVFGVTEQHHARW